jgi:hypothetical protein
VNAIPLNGDRPNRPRITDEQRAACDAALTAAARIPEARTFARSDDGAQLIELIRTCPAVTDYLAGAAATYPEAKVLTRLCAALARVTRDPRAAAGLYCLIALAHLTHGGRRTARLYARMALTCRPGFSTPRIVLHLSEQANGRETARELAAHARAQSLPTRERTKDTAADAPGEDSGDETR